MRELADYKPIDEPVSRASAHNWGECDVTIRDPPAVDERRVCRICQSVCGICNRFGDRALIGRHHQLGDYCGIGAGRYQSLAPVDTRASDFNQLVTVISKIVLAVMPFALLVSYWLIFWTVTGQTVGKRIMGVRVVRMDGQRMKTGNSVRRIIMYFVCMIPFFLGFFVDF